MLNVKNGMSTDIIYDELKRPVITSKTKDKQYTFFQKMLKFPVDVERDIFHCARAGGWGDGRVKES